MTRKIRIGLVVGGALIAFVPLALHAASIVGTKHDLSATTANAAAHAVTETQICVFCHTPHQAMSQALLWNHNPGTVNGFSSGQTTQAGTPLPTTLNNGVSKKCLSCHDGTISIGDTAGGAITVTGTGLDGTGAIVADRVGDKSSIDTNHPVGVPYAAEPAYNGAASAATVATGTYKSLASAQAAGIKFFTKALATDTGRGVECASCHDVHGAAGFASFLRIENTGSALWLTCHDQ
jgi:predicted CXXCH cytochrome family protein